MKNYMLDIETMSTGPDAEWQAEYLIELVQKHNLSNVL